MLFLDEIHIRERLVLDELDNIYGKDCIESLNQKSDLSNKVESLRSTCKLAETILNGKDIELLLLRSDVQEKLSLLNQLDFGVLPSTVSKAVEFTSGSIEFGSLCERNTTAIDDCNVSKSEKKICGQLLNTNVHKAIAPAKCDLKCSKDLSDNDDDDDVDSDESSLSDASSDSNLETNTRKSVMTKNQAVQTEQTESCGNLKPQMIDQMTITSAVSMQDKAVNTRARSMLKNQRN